tara:strand:- start:631 stop:1254 length:624 start_codon:yes stop_codon:yes gene_type:complete
MKCSIANCFPIPIYSANRNIDFISEEKTIIEELLKEKTKNRNNSFSENTYVLLHSSLQDIRIFCEDHINNYVKSVMQPLTPENDIYITQSWININKPGESHHLHNHPNSIISGVFYVSTLEVDCICFKNPNTNIRNNITYRLEHQNVYNQDYQVQYVKDNDLVLFPSWLEHMVIENNTVDSNRISISFNTYAATLGDRRTLSSTIRG